MKYLFRLSLICIAVLYGTVYLAEVQNEVGRTLCELDNLPHRGLGMLYCAHIMMPHRADYANDYFKHWLLVSIKDKEVMIEGQRRPVVPMYSASVARQFPENKQLQTINRAIYLNHFGLLKTKE